MMVKKRTRRVTETFPLSFYLFEYGVFSKNGVCI